MSKAEEEGKGDEGGIPFWKDVWSSVYGHGVGCCIHSFGEGSLLVLSFSAIASSLRELLSFFSSFVSVSSAGALYGCVDDEKKKKKEGENA